MATSSTRKVHYRERDGQPMGETKSHRNATIELIQGLEDWFADDPMAYVSGDDFIYWVEGQPKFNVSPDVWCVRGVIKTGLRRVYKTWAEGGHAPDLVVEMTSRSTRREDLGKKFRIYQDDLKVREYFLFDPLGEYLPDPFQGYRRVNGVYQPIRLVNGRLPSEVLNLHLQAVDHFVRLYNPATGQTLPTRREGLEAARVAQSEVDARLREQEAIIEAKEATIEAKEATIRAKDAEIEWLRQTLAAAQAMPKPKRK